jgi:hypothetical protein
MAVRKVEGTFRLNIDGHWEAEQLIALLRSLEDIYNLTSILESRRITPNEVRELVLGIDRRTVRRLAIRSGKASPLTVPQFKYASPGFADLLGVGKAIKHVKDFIMAITDRVLAEEQRELENDARLIANQKAVSDQRFLEKEREILLDQKKQIHHLTVAEKKLENLKLAEDIQAARLTNRERELTVFSASLSRMMNQKELGGEEQARLVHWIGSRMKPVAELAEEGKLLGVAEISTKPESQ